MSTPSLIETAHRIYGNIRVLLEKCSVTGSSEAAALIEARTFIQKCIEEVEAQLEQAAGKEASAPEAPESVGTEEVQTGVAGG